MSPGLTITRGDLIRAKLREQALASEDTKTDTDVGVDSVHHDPQHFLARESYQRCGSSSQDTDPTKEDA